MNHSASTESRVVLVTGATTGIGLALSQALRRAGYRTVLTARAASLGRFQTHGIIEDEHCLIRPLDVGIPSQAQAVVSEIMDHWRRIDILINNAGVCFRAVMEHLGERDELQQFHINYNGPMYLTRLVLPHMRRARSGHIINLSSVGGMMAMPTMGGYSASKFALEGASEALWYEMRPWGVHVTLIEPGFVRSTSFENARFTTSSAYANDQDSDPYHPYYANLIPFIARMMNASFTTPEDIADRVLRLLTRKHPPLRIHATLDARLFSLMRRFLPQWLYHRVLYYALPNIRSWAPPQKEDDRVP